MGAAIGVEKYLPSEILQRPRENGEISLLVDALAVEELEQELAQLREERHRHSEH